MMIGRTRNLQGFGNGGTGIPTTIPVTPNQAIATTIPDLVVVTPNQLTSGSGGGGWLTSLIGAGAQAGITALNQPAAKARAQAQAAQTQQGMTLLLLLGGGLLLFMLAGKK